MKGDDAERRRLKGVFKAKAKLGVEDYYDRLATQAEEGVRQNNLRSLYRIIREMRGNFTGNATDSAPVAKKDGSLCNSAQELLERWREHYQELLNRESATTCRELDSAAAAATPDIDSLEEVRTAISKLRNGRAAGLDELLKCAKEQISVALHTVCKGLNHRQAPRQLEGCHYRFSVQRQRIQIKLCQLQTYTSVVCSRQSVRSCSRRETTTTAT